MPEKTGQRRWVAETAECDKGIWLLLGTTAGDRLVGIRSFLLMAAILSASKAGNERT